VLLSSGAGAADVNATMAAITAACGLRNVEVDVTFTSLALSYQPGPTEQSHTQIRQLRRRTADYGTLTSVDLLVRALMLGEIDRDEARTALASGVILGEYVAQPLEREARRVEARLAGPRLFGPFRPRSQRAIRRAATRQER
jgi:hypothetical protein